MSEERNPMELVLLACIEEGRQARAAGKSEQDNPYKARGETDPACVHWLMGFNET